MQLWAVLELVPLPEHLAVLKLAATTTSMVSLSSSAVAQALMTLAVATADLVCAEVTASVLPISLCNSGMMIVWEGQHGCMITCERSAALQVILTH